MVITGLRDERGFTFLELLLVMLLVGVLAAIALPAFLGQRGGGFDAEAKSTARNLLLEIESCFTRADDYRGCDAPAELRRTGLPLGSGPGQVDVTVTGANSFRIVATSRGLSGGAPRVFEIVKSHSGPVERTCGPAAGIGEGGCPSSGFW
jgi:type IV pilus assembly protein PilA